MLSLNTFWTIILYTSAAKHIAAKDVCETPACKALAERILSYMNPNTKPCDDFYKFSCRKFEESAVIPDDQTSNTCFDQVTNKLEDQLKTIFEEPPNPEDILPYKNLRHLFSLCMDENKINDRGIAHALAKLKEAGGWPVLGNWKEENWDFLDTEIKLRNLFIGGRNIIDVYITTDIKNTSRRVLEVDQSNLGLYREYLVRGMDEKEVQSYYRYMVDIAVMFGANRETATNQLKDSLQFEIELAKLTVPREDRREFKRMHNPFYLQKLKTEIPWVDWDKLLGGILPSDVPLKTDETVIVVEVDFLKKLNDFLKTYPKIVIANYMMWHAARDMVELLTSEMKDRTQAFRQEVIGTKAREARWKECVGVAGSLQIALSSLYVKKYFDATSKKEALDMATNIKEEMQKVLREVEWMDQATRERALTKILKLHQHIGYPDELTDKSNIEKHYEGLELNGEHFFDEMMKLYEFGHRLRYKRLREPVDRADWRDHSRITVVNAYYNPLENSMMFPAGILQQPFFHADLPKYVNYASIGSVIAHETTHGYDDMGCQFNQDGNLEAWWTAESKEVFYEKKKCFIDQYGGFKDALTQLNLNGITTQGENVADNGGLKLAYRAYKNLQLNEPLLPGLEAYNQEQLFMMSSAAMWCSRYREEALKVKILTGVHPPAEFRVNGVLKNFPEFSRLFQCSDKDEMNPQTKCVVW